MEFVPVDKILKLRPDTKQHVRQLYGFDKPGSLEEAIRILQEWIEKQPHFNKKDFGNHYLESTLITSKGSIERAKLHLDKICTMRTLMPQFFGKYNTKTDFEQLHQVVHSVLLPKLTEDHFRIHITKVIDDDWEPSLVLDFYRHGIMIAEYAKTHDYICGFVLVYDFSEASVMSLLTKMSPILAKQAMTVLIEGYGMRVKRIHVISDSKFVDGFVSLLKQVVSAKIASRINVHKSVEELLEFYPKDILPKDYGGEERSLKTLNGEWLDVLSSEEHLKYLEDMNKATTNESLRPKEQFYEQYCGMPVMEAIPSEILEFNPDTFLHLKQQYDLDKPGRMEDAIKLLEDWLKKQEHFMRKEFPKSYLERTIIFSKGSVERAKHKLENLCMFRTLFPEIFEVFDIENSPLLDEIKAGFLPKLTSNHCRVFALKNSAKCYDNRVFDLYRYFIMQCEYIQAHDYCDGVILLLDYSEANIMETMKVFNIVDVRDILRVFKEGYGMRIKGIHFLTGSKTIDMLVSLFKQVLSEKVAGRIKAHATIETVYEYVPKDILPVEYGGKEKPLIEIHRKYQEVMSSKEFTDYLTEMSHACTDENLRTTVNGDNQMMGASGTFRSLQVD